ncbi:right-handed parallel beta-helix repeat-containing protein [Pseudocolwellia agarivorans]|uniref:right-handed parallel beta-helix repeat-containing protein n=1 Tax=Pseudocolwellia agarivorans TaxID=1911682 RepID=UPI003F88530A
MFNKIIKVLLNINIICLILFLTSTYCRSNDDVNSLVYEIFVSPSGSDNGIGSLDDPLNTVQKALALAREIKDMPVNIWLREGTYFLDNKIKVSKIDDRLIYAPLSISAYKSENATLSGAKALPYWNKVVDSVILKRLPEKSKKHIYVTNLREYGITDFGSAKSGGVNLYFNNMKMNISRYPNHGYLKIEELVEPDTRVVRGYKGSKTGKFYYKEDSINSWSDDKNILMSGYWFWDWKDQIHEVDSINTISKIITVKKPYHHYGYRKGQEYFAYNILAELDAPNEWYLDRDTGKLYFYPAENITRNNAPVLAVTKDLVELNDVSNITIKNLTFSYARNNGIGVKGGNNNNITNVVIKHIGNQAVSIRNSYNSMISSSHIYSIGANAISLNGGDRDSLTSANICAINNKIHDYAKTIKTYKAAITLGGVGNCAKNNEIFNAPHIGIFFQGNNHVIEYNNIHNVVQESNDAGAIYAGRDWTSRGTVINNNYLHDIQGFKGKGAKGIYLDDEFSGVTITGNIFNNVRDAVFIGGGRDNIVDNNLFINSFRSIYVDLRGISWGKNVGSQLTSKLENVPHKSEVWKNEYPDLSNVLTLAPRLPVGNVIKNNVFYDDKWNYVFDKAKQYVTFENNHHIPASSPTENYQVKSPLKGFSNIPFEKIGVK